MKDLETSLPNQLQQALKVISAAIIALVAVAILVGTTNRRFR